MRILTIGNMYPPHHLGGYEVTWRSTVLHLRASGHRVKVLATDYRDPTPDPNIPEDVDAHRELRWYWRDHGWPRLSARQRLALERHNGRVLEDHLREFKPDAVSWWAMGGMSLSLIERVRRHGIPTSGVVGDDWMIYSSVHDAWLRVVSRASLRPLRPLIELATGVPARLDMAATRWLFISETVRRRALSRGLVLPQTEIAHPGIDPDLFHPAEPHDWAWRLLYVGRIDERKGIETAIRALPFLPPEATLTVDGGGDDREVERLRGVAVDLALTDRVRFQRSPRGDLPELYARGDVVVFPVQWEEPWGLVPLEAMAVGTPVVATGRGGSGEYLRHQENALIFDAADGGESLAVAVRRLSTEPALRAALRERGLETAAGLTERAFGDAVEAALLPA